MSNFNVAFALYLSLLTFSDNQLTAQVRPPRPLTSQAGETQRQDSQETAAEPDDQKLPTIAEQTKGLSSHPGFQTFYWDETAGKVWFELDHLGDEFIYVTGLSSGLGSNPVGLDRGQLGETSVVRFRRVGRRVFLEQRNLRYRASADHPSERQAVADSFAQSILWSAEIVAESDDRVLIDGTSLLLRDAHGVTQTLSRSNQGSFSLDANRSFVHLPRCQAFPDNSEFEVVLTFASTSPGGRVRETTPNGEAVTLRQHHSFVRLPDAGYQPRRYDPRTGSFAIEFADYSVPLDAPLEQRYLVRHRLQKKDPHAAVSEAIEPIVYYVDPGVPQPVRDALLEGARWWNEAFEKAGFKDAYRVEVLPEDADPMDVRYNVIQWVHRSTRGWSYGQSVVDPRTGEIIKGHVLLGSLRVRQDRLIFDGLRIAHEADRAMSLPAHPLDVDRVAQHRVAQHRVAQHRVAQHRVANSCRMPANETSAEALSWVADETPIEVALARIRQLSAHEVGHTLGFAHNFAGSTYADRASVMDYPAPRIKLNEDGSFDLSDAYGEGIGLWDIFAVKYAYAQFAPGADEAAELQKLVEEALANDWLYLSDADARSSAAADARANLWDDGSDPIEELHHLMNVRSLALERFDEHAVAAGSPLADLEQVLVPIYLLHRYQVEGTAKLIGGVSYRYAVRGDGGPPMQVVPKQRQQQALSALLETIQPQQLVLRKELTDLLPPQPHRSATDEERFPGRTAMIFDPLAAAEVSAEWTLGCILQPERLNRLLTQREGLAVSDVIDQTIRSTWLDPLPDDWQQAAVARTINATCLRQLLQLATNNASHPDVVALTRHRLRQLATELRGRAATVAIDSESQRLTVASWLHAADQIDRFLADDREGTTSGGLALPPGSPIGQD